MLVRGGVDDDPGRDRAHRALKTVAVGYVEDDRPEVEVGELACKSALSGKQRVLRVVDEHQSLRREPGHLTR